MGPAVRPPYRPVPGSPGLHVRVDDRAVLVAEHDLSGPLSDLITAVVLAMVSQPIEPVTKRSQPAAGGEQQARTPGTDDLRAATVAADAAEAAGTGSVLSAAARAADGSRCVMGI